MAHLPQDIMNIKVVGSSACKLVYYQPQKILLSKVLHDIMKLINPVSTCSIPQAV
jgi:hypothetical protein